MIRKALVVFLSSVCVVPALLAQNTRPSPAAIAQRIVSHYATLLDLSAGQQSQALPIFTTEVTAESSAQTDERNQQKALHTAVVNGDSAGMQAGSTAIGSDTTAEVLARATAEAAFYQILTAPGQQAKYTQLLGHGGRPGGWGGGRGPGGPGPGPGDSQ